MEVGQANMDSTDRFPLAYSNFFFFPFFLFWLHWVLVAAHGIFTVACGLVALWHVLPGKSHGQRSWWDIVHGFTRVGYD